MVDYMAALATICFMLFLGMLSTWISGTPTCCSYTEHMLFV